MRGQGSLDSLEPQPGQFDLHKRSYHPLPGEWAQQQLSKSSMPSKARAASPTKQSELQRALAQESAQHAYWEKWQGVTPAKPAYNNPREWQNTLIPSAKYGTEGR